MTEPAQPSLRLKTYPCFDCGAQVLVGTYCPRCFHPTVAFDTAFELGQVEVQIKDNDEC